MQYVGRSLPMRGEPSSTQAVDVPDLALPTCLSMLRIRNISLESTSCRRCKKSPPKKNPKQTFEGLPYMTQSNSSVESNLDEYGVHTMDRTNCHMQQHSLSYRSPLAKAALIRPAEFVPVKIL